MHAFTHLECWHWQRHRPCACLANAVSDALAPFSGTINATPSTPESVLQLIHAASR